MAMAIDSVTFQVHQTYVPLSPNNGGRVDNETVDTTVAILS